MGFVDRMENVEQSPSVISFQHVVFFYLYVFPSSL